MKKAPANIEVVPQPQLGPTPMWVRKVCPEVPSNIPIDVIAELTESYETTQKDKWSKDQSKKTIAISAISAYLNNFYFRITEREMYLKNRIEKPDLDIIGTQTPYLMSDLLRRQTWREFFERVDIALAQTGISPEKLQQIRKNQGSESFILAFLPAFILLRQQGYKHYPDLTQ